MKKLATSGFTGRLCFALSALLCVLSNADAQDCVMSCPPNNPPVQVSVSSDCQDTLTYDILGVVLSGCIGEIVVDIMENGSSLGDIITSEMVGNTYMVVISHPISGQSCMTTILVLDKQAPIVDCPDDITLECTADLDAYNPIDSSDISDCAGTIVYKYDLLVSSGNCEDDIISQYFRTYVIVDEYNNADTCEQFISLQKADLEDVVFPPHLVGVNALSCFPPPDTSAENTGIPSINGNPILNGAFCNLSVTMVDFEVPLCGGGYKILRTWTVYDWCANNISIDSTQIIEVIDITPPDVTAPVDMTISASLAECLANVLLPPAIITEDCSPGYTVRVEGPFGTIQGNGGQVNGLPVGIHNIVYIATNGCNLMGMDTMVLTIEDLQPPVPVCHQTLAIPLDNLGTAIISAAAFNAASFDNCGDVYFKVKRMSAPSDYSCSNPGNPLNLFDDFIQFCCEDIANNEIMVILRVYDLPPIPGPVSDSYLAGHFNECMVQVEVQDKLPPSIICPIDLTISCLFPFAEENLAVFGTIALAEEDREQICLDDPGVPGNPGLQCFGLDGLALDNCNVEVTTSAAIDVNMCGVGSIIRLFTATDDGGRQSTCQQVISIINYNLFDLSDIVWPADYTTSDICDISLLDPEDLFPPYNEPVLSDGPCDLVGANYVDAVFDFSNTDQACFKILRTWTVIDWCQLNSQSGGLWSHIQVIKVMNNIGPAIESLPDLNECSFDPECEGLVIDFEAIATDDCSSAASISWRYFIDIDNNQSFDFTSQIVIGDTLRFSRDLPIGSHRILYTVWDQCGNITTEEQLVNVVSCKAPSAKCIHGLSTNLMAMDLDGDGTADWGMVTLQADMFDAGSDHPCGNSLTVAFSENPLDVTLVFDCGDLGDNEIELWAIDENGLTDFCITTVDIQDNNNICPPELGGIGTISGNISVPGSGKLAGAMVYLDGSNAEGIPSGSNGYFVFPSMPLGGQYDVRPLREGDARNGVTTLDLVKIQKHLLGIELFKNPYQYIAADANNSNSITAIDIVQLRKLILGYYTELPSNRSWRFIDSKHVFPDENNPWLTQWPETYSIHPFNSTMSDVNFDAVKVGDVNLTASTQARSSVILPRNADQCVVEYRPVADAEEGVVRIDVVLQNARLYNAIQFSFTWDQVSYPLMDWSPGEQTTTDEIRMPLGHGEAGSVAIFSASGWNEEEIVLFSFRIKRTSAPLSNYRFMISHGPTEAVAYTVEQEKLHTIRLEHKSSQAITVYNRPNPFKDATTIVFESKALETAQLNIFDLSGKMVFSRQVQLQHGQNEYFIHRSDLSNPGMYSYEMKSETQHSTNRMIIVD